MKLGMTIFVSYVHLAKVLLPIDVREIGMTILVSWTHPSKAEYPNDATLGWMECGGKIHEEEIKSGMMIMPSEVHSMKAEASINLMVAGMTMKASDLQCWIA